MPQIKETLKYYVTPAILATSLTKRRTDAGNVEMETVLPVLTLALANAQNAKMAMLSQHGTRARLVAIKIAPLVVAMENVPNAKIAGTWQAINLASFVKLNSATLVPAMGNALNV